MKYETPEVTALTPAISAIQGVAEKQVNTPDDGGTGAIHNESSGAYQDWE